MRNKIKPYSSAYPSSPLAAHCPNVANLAMDNFAQVNGKWQIPFPFVRIPFLDGIPTKAVRPTSTGITYNRSKLAQFYQRICLTVPFTAETFHRKFLLLFFEETGTEFLDQTTRSRLSDAGEKEHRAPVIMMSPRDKGMVTRSLWNFSWTSKQFIRLKLKHKGKTHGARAPSRSPVEFSRRATLIAPLDFSPEVTVSGDFSSTSFIWRPLARTAAASCRKSGQRRARNKKSKTKRRKSPVAREIARDRFETCCQKRLCVFFFSFLFSPLGTLKFDTANFVIELCSRYM